MRGGKRRGRRAAAGGSATIAGGADPAQLLPMALHHHERGNLERAGALYREVIAARPDHADALQFYGIVCLQRGDLGQAEEYIRRAIELNPGVAPYHDNLGTVFERTGRLREAVAAYHAAEALEPGDPDRAYNLGLVLKRLGRLEEAERHLRLAVEARPEDTEPRLALANLLKARGAGQQAQELYRSVLGASSSHGGALINLGNLLQDQDRVEEAEGLYRQALAAAPTDPIAHHNLGRLLHRAGRTDEARQCFEEALRYAPALVEARVGLAQTLEESGLLHRALAAYRAACEAGEPLAEAREGLLRVARIHPGARHDSVLERELVDAVETGRQPASALARALGVQLAAKAGVLRSPPAHDAQALERALALADDPLLRALCERTANVVAAVERWLVAARRALLLHGVPQGPRARALLRALALQGHLNEHVFALEPDEARAVQALGARVEEALANGELPADVDLGLLACCVPLATMAGAERLAALALPPGHAWLAAVIERAVRWPLEERDRAAGIPDLGPLRDPVSQAVRAQYEESPYPRWSELPAIPAAGEQEGAAGDARFADRLRSQSPLDVLVAGCGTGQEPLALAARFPGHRIVALDLSRASLAYAARMAHRLGIEGIELVHGDLLDAARLGRRFDVITATGVLHHLADPLAGWRALRDCLSSGGLMRVGLYSRAARRVVEQARARIAELGLTPGVEGVRALRRRVLAGQEPALEALLDSEDFYTTSACRDLLFHPVEHRFDLAEVAVMLEALDLEFLGFRVHPLIERRFREAGQGAIPDLGAWARFESANPDAFQEMYVFWCRARGGERD